MTRAILFKDEWKDSLLIPRGEEMEKESHIIGLRREFETWFKLATLIYNVINCGLTRFSSTTLFHSLCEEAMGWLKVSLFPLDFMSSII